MHVPAAIAVRFNAHRVGRFLTERPVVTWGVVAAGLLATALATYAFGGTASAVPHLGHLFVVIAAVTMGPAAGAACGLLAGALLGPPMPLDVAGGTAQSVEGWLLRMIVFTLVGTATGLLARAVRSADAVFLRTLEQLPTAVIAGTGADVDARLTYANDAAVGLLGDVVGDTLAAVLARVDARTTDGCPVTRDVLAWDRTATSGSATPTEFTLRGADGRPRVVRARALQTPSGQAVAALEDLTAEFHFERARRNLITLAGHHLRTPLTPVVGFADTIARHATMADDETLAGYARVLQRSAARLHGLVERLTELAQLEPAPAHAQQRVRVRDLLDEVVADLCEPEGVRVVGDPDLVVEVAHEHIRRALAELVRNALTHGRPPVFIDTTRGDTSIDVRVRDSGSGFRAGMVPTDLFLPHGGDVDEPDLRAPEGPGLGLALARAHCQAAGATLELVQPACFQVSIPVQCEPAPLQS